MRVPGWWGRTTLHPRTVGEFSPPPIPIWVHTDDPKFTFFGIKNNTSRTGFEVVLPRAKDRKLDPVYTLECYLELKHIESKEVPYFCL